VHQSSYVANNSIYYSVEKVFVSDGYVKKKFLDVFVIRSH